MQGADEVCFGTCNSGKKVYIRTNSLLSIVNDAEKEHTMSEYDEKLGVLIGGCGKLEQKLRNLRGATGAGFKELLATSYLDSETERKIRFVARVRNRCAHEDNKPALEQIDKAIKILNEVKIVKAESPPPVVPPPAAGTPPESCHDNRYFNGLNAFVFRAGISLLMLSCGLGITYLALLYLSTEAGRWAAAVICGLGSASGIGWLWSGWGPESIPKNAFTYTVVCAMYVLLCILVFLFLFWLLT